MKWYLCRMEELSMIETTEEAMAHLSQVDEEMGELIDWLGPLSRPASPDLFSALVRSVLSQQVSLSAAESVRLRLEDLLGGDVTPERLLAESPESLRGVGMSRTKAGYLLGISEAFVSGRISRALLDPLTDEEVTKQLTALKGVGPWTAEMILIFALGRPDVLSYGDYGIRRGLMRLHDLDDLPRDTFDHYRALYHPYGTAASLYLWEVSKGGL